MTVQPTTPPPSTQARVALLWVALQVNDAHLPMPLSIQCPGGGEPVEVNVHDHDWSEWATALEVGVPMVDPLTFRSVRRTAKSHTKHVVLGAIFVNDDPDPTPQTQAEVTTPPQVWDDEEEARDRG